MSTSSRNHAVVIGASSDIGCAVSGRLASLDYRVIGTYRDETRAKLISAACLPAGEDPLLIAFDVRDRVTDRLRAEVGGAGSGRLTAVVYVAGAIESGHIEALTDDDWDRVMDVNVGGAFRAVRALLPLMTDGGAIVFVGSTAHRLGAGPPAYVASKAALRALAKSLAQHLARRRIRINTVEPGFVDTRFEGDSEQEAFRRRSIGAMIPCGRLATADEVGDMVVVGLTNPYVTGATLTLAGGAVMD